MSGPQSLRGTMCSPFLLFNIDKVEMMSVSNFSENEFVNDVVKAS